MIKLYKSADTDKFKSQSAFDSRSFATDDDEIDKIHLLHNKIRELELAIERKKVCITA